MAEGYGPWRMGDDDALLPLIGAANIACGGHAGDAATMRAACAKAAAMGVDIGAHPSLNDIPGFGRRAFAITPEAAAELVAAQTGALIGAAALAGARVVHVKPHGALNNIAAADRAIADGVARAVRAVDPTLILLAPARSELCAAGEAAGLRVAREAFADRAYQPDGRLAPRGEPGAVLADAEAIAAQALRIVEGGGLPLADGRVIETPVESICVHGDGPDAVAALRRLVDALRSADWDLVPLTALDAN